MLWAQQEVLVTQVLRESFLRDEALELGLGLGVGQTIGNRSVDRALAGRIGLRIDQTAPERRVVFREGARQVLVLGRNGIRVLVPAAVMRQVREPGRESADIAVGIA